MSNSFFRKLSMFRLELKAIPPAISSFTSLEGLNLRSNEIQLSDQDIEVLKPLTNLTSIDFNRNGEQSDEMVKKLKAALPKDCNIYGLDD